MAFDPAKYRSGIAIADGDFAAEYSLRRGAAPALWEQALIEAPELVRDIARAFAASGAEVLTTPTDGANLLSIAERRNGAAGGGDDVEAMNRVAAEAYRSAAGQAGPTRVWGAIGPVERLLALEEIEEDALYAAYEAQAAALAGGGVDAILCRSFIELEALRVAVRAAAKTGRPVIGSMAFDCGASYTETTMGATVPQACTALEELGAAMVGCDRGVYPDATAEIVSLMKKSCRLPIFAAINAGPPELGEEGVVYPEPPRAYADRFRTAAAAGAAIVGGGCGATADHIAALVKARDAYHRRPKRD